MSDTIEGRLHAVKGKVSILRDGQTFAVSNDDPIYEADILITAENSSVDILFRDGTKSRVSENAEIRLSDYEFSEAESAFMMNIVHGAVRTMSGEIVKINPEAFEIITPRATIGIRGTEFVNIVEQGFEQHALLFISDGHVMLVTSKDGSVNELTDPLEIASISDTSSGQVLIESFTLSEMLHLIKALAPSLIPHLGYGSLDLEKLANEFPNSKILPDEIIEQIEEENSQNQSLEYENAYNALTFKQLIIIESDTIEYKSLLEALDQSVIHYELLPSSAFTENLYSSDIFDTNAFFTETIEQITAQISPSPSPSTVISNQTFTYNTSDDTVSFNQEMLSSKVDLGAGHDTLTITEAFTGGFIHGGDGNDSIVLSSTLDDPNPGAARSFIQVPILDAGAGNDIVELQTLVKGHIDLGTENDTLTIVDMQDGNIDANLGDDEIIIDKISTGIVYTSDGNDLVSVKALDQSSTNVPKFYGGAGNDILAHTDTNALSHSDFEVFISGADAHTITSLATLSSLGLTVTNDLHLDTASWHIYNDTISAKNANLTLESTISVNDLSHFVDITASSKDITTASLDDTIHISSISTHNINTLAGSDSINIKDFNAGILNTGEGNDTLIVENFNAGEALLDVGDDSFIVENFNNGKINTGFNDDFVLVKNYTSGSIDAELGNDVLVGKNLTAVSAQGFETFIHGADAELITSKSALASFGVTINPTNILLSDKWALSGAEYKHVDYNIFLSSSQPISQFVDSNIVDTTHDIEGQDLADTITVTNNATHNITTNGGEDLVTIENALANTVDTGNHNDSITITKAQSANILSGSGNDDIKITTLEGGKLESGTGADNIYIENITSSATVDAIEGNNSIEIGSFNTGTVSSGTGSDKVNIELFTEGTLNTESGNDTVTITTMNGGTITNLSDSDTVTITNFNNGTVTGSRSEDVFYITHLNGATISNNNGGDSIYIDTMQKGTITSTYGSSSFVFIENYTAGTIKLADDSDYIISKQDLSSCADINFVENFIYGNDATKITSYEDLLKFGIFTFNSSSSYIIQSLSSEWAEDKGIYKHKNLDIFIKSNFLNQNITLENSLSDIATGSRNDYIHINNEAKHNISTDDGTDSITIGTLNSATINAGTDNDTITIDIINSGTVESGVSIGNDIVNITTMNGGEIKNTAHADTVTVTYFNGGTITGSTDSDVFYITNFNANAKLASSSGDDSIYITNMNGGTLKEVQSSGSDFVYIENYQSGIIETNNSSVDFDILVSKQDLTENSDIENFESYLYGKNANLVQSFDDFTKYGINIASNLKINSLSSDWIEINGIYKHNSYDLFLKSEFLNNAIVLTDTNKEIITHDGADSITISNTASHNISTNSNNDTINIGTLTSLATINSGIGDDSIKITVFEGSLNSDSGNDYIEINTMNSGSITNHAGNDILSIVNFNNGNIQGSGFDESYTITNFNGGTIDTDAGDDTISITNMQGGTIKESYSSSSDELISIKNYFSGSIDASYGNDILISKTNLSEIKDIINIETYIYGTDALNIKTSEDLLKYGIVLDSSSLISELSSAWTRQSDGNYKHTDNIFIESKFLAKNISLDNTTQNINTYYFDDTITILDTASHSINTFQGNDSISIINSESLVSSDLGDDTVRITSMEKGSVNLGAGNDFLIIENYTSGSLTASTGNDFLISKEDISSQSSVSGFEYFLYGDDALAITDKSLLASYGITLDAQHNITSFSDKWTINNNVYSHSDYNLFLKAQFGENISIVDTIENITTGSFNDFITITGTASHAIHTENGNDSIKVNILSLSANDSIRAGSGNNIIEVTSLESGTIYSSDADTITIGTMSDGKIYNGSGTTQIDIETMSGGRIEAYSHVEIVNIDTFSNNAYITLGLGNDSVYIKDMQEGQISLGDGHDFISIENYSAGSISGGNDNDLLVSTENLSNNAKITDFASFLFGTDAHNIQSFSDLYKYGIYIDSTKEITSLSDKWTQSNGVYTHEDYNLSLKSIYLQQEINLLDTFEEITTGNLDDSITITGSANHAISTSSGDDSIKVNILALSANDSIRAGSGSNIIEVTSFESGNIYSSETDTISIGTMSGGKIYNGSGTTDIDIEIMTGGRIEAYSHLEIVNIDTFSNNAYISLGSENDSVYIKDMQEGLIDLGNNHDFISIEKYSAGSISGGNDNDLLVSIEDLSHNAKITNFESFLYGNDASLITNFEALAKYGIFTNSSKQIISLSSDWKENNGIFEHNSLDLKLETLFLNQNIELENTIEDITTGLYSDIITINNNSSHNISTFDGNDSVYIKNFNAGTISAGGGNNFIDIDTMTGGTLSQSSSNTVHIDKVLGGKITASSSEVFFIQSFANATLASGSDDDSISIIDMQSGSIDLGGSEDFIYLADYTGGTIKGGAQVDILVSKQDLSTNANITEFESYLYGENAHLITDFDDLADYGIYSTSSKHLSSLSEDWQETNGVFTHVDYGFILKSTYLAQNHVYENSSQNIVTGVNNDTITIRNTLSHTISALDGDDIINVEQMLSGEIKVSGDDSITIKTMDNGNIEGEANSNFFIDIETMNNGTIETGYQKDFIRVQDFNGGLIDTGDRIDVILSLEDLSQNTAITNAEVFIYGKDIDLISSYDSLTSFGVFLDTSEGDFNLNSDWIIKDYVYTHKEHDLAIKTLFIASNINLDDSTENIVTQALADTITINNNLSHAITTNNGNDYVLVNNAGNVYINVGAGDDTVIIAHADSTRIVSDNGNDVITITDFTNNSSIYTEEGNDSIYITNMSSGTIDTGSDNDLLFVNNYTDGIIDMNIGNDILVSNLDLSENVDIEDVESFIYSQTQDLSNIENLAELGITINEDNTITLSSLWHENNGVYSNNANVFIKSNEATIDPSAPITTSLDNTAEDAYKAVLEQNLDII